MTIASEITDLNTNLQAAKAAVTAKGGTVGDTGLAGLAAEIQTIPNGGGSTEPSSGGHITAYDTTTGVITGDGFGSTQGTVYLLDRDTNSYVSQPVSSWSDTSITLTTPVDLSVIEGSTSLSVVDSTGKWASKWLLQGDITVTGYGYVYREDPNTRVVQKITIADETEFNLLYAGQAANYSAPLTFGGNAIYSDEIVGVQIGTSARQRYSGSYYFLAKLPNMNQPIVIPNEFAGDYFASGYYYMLSYCLNYNQPVKFENNITAVPSYFMQSCTTFNQKIYFPATVARISTYYLALCYSYNQSIDDVISLVDSNSTNFLNQCEAFNQPIDFSHVTVLPNNFMAGCDSFDQPITLPEGLTAIPNSFLIAANSFDSLITFPSTLTSIGSHFLAISGNNTSSRDSNLAMRYNQPITLPPNLTSIGGYFLWGCGRFNQPLVIPNTVTTIGSCFLSGYDIGNHQLRVQMTFDQPLTLPTGLTSIGGGFLAGCHCFDHEIVIPSVTTIDADFLADCWAFNKRLTLPSGLTTIGSRFMYNCHSFNYPLEIPSTVTSIGGYFLYYAQSFSSLSVPAGITYTSDNYSLAMNSNYPAKIYTLGVTVTGAGAAEAIAAWPDNPLNYMHRKLINGN